MSTATSDMRRRWAAHGFTMIEVIGAVAAFVIAFLAGSAAFARLLQQQSTTYHRTLSAAAAMLLTDWHVDQACPGPNGFVDDVVDTSPTAIDLTKVLIKVTATSNLEFRGDDYAAGDTVCVFKTANVGNIADKALLTYRPLIVTVSPASSPETDSGMRWCQLSFWHGQAENVLANKPTTMLFLTRFLVPDRHP